MLTEYLFVSCDIVAHSAEPRIEVQVARVCGINRTVSIVLQQYRTKDLVWASGGDGGHVAIPWGDAAPAIALQLVCALRQWSLDEFVPLRVLASAGQACELSGADGRSQLVGPGINTAGRLLPYGGASRVVATDAFRSTVKDAADDEFQFHHRVSLEPRNSQPLTAWLLSRKGQFSSTWEHPESTTDAALLAAAVRSADALEVIYRARRLLELNNADVRAIQALRSVGEMTIKGKRNFLHKLIQDEHVGPELIRLGNLLERGAGETVCSAGDAGTSMFLILHGRLQVFFAADAAPDAPRREEGVVMAPGDLGGELAFALRRSRTATLQCLEDTALLTFTYEELKQSFASSAGGEAVERALKTEMRAKVLENLCNTAPFFRPVWRVLSQASKTTPWTSLLPHSELVTVPASNLRINFPLLPGAEEIIFLVSGSLRAEGSADYWSGESYPVIYAHLTHGAQPTLSHMLLREDCEVLRVKRDGLLRLGPDAFELICDEVAKTLVSKERVERAQPLSSSSIATRLVFISYCRDNLAEVAALRERLIRSGEVVWWDHDILPGADWKFEIRRAMRQSYAVICCLSKELASRSKSGVYPELADAVAALRERPQGEIFLIPLRLSDCSVPQIEIDDTRTLDRLQTLDLFPGGELDAKFERLLSVLRGLKAR